MKKAVLQFTACCMAVGVSVASIGGVAFADQSGTLAGFGLTAEADPAEEVTSVTVSVAEESDSLAQQTVAGVEMDEEDEAGEPAEVSESVVEADEDADDAYEVGYGVIKYNATGDVKEVSDEEEEDDEDGEEEESEPESESESETEEDKSSLAGVTAQTEDEEAKDSLEDDQAFAQCEDYINVRKEADEDGEVVGKLYNNNVVTILEEDDDWYKIKSGNVTGYAKAEYFATGEEAEKIAQSAAQEVATVKTDILTVRSSGSTDADSIGMLYEDDQVEVVSKDGDWIKVKLDDGTYGYVSAEFVDCETVFTTGETVEEEQTRLNGEMDSYTESQGSTQVTSAVYTETPSSYYEETYVEPVFYEETYYDEPDTYYEEVYYEPDTYYEEVYYYEPDTYYEEVYYEPDYTYTYTETYVDTSSVDALYQIYLDAQAAADAAAMQGDEALIYETYNAAVEAYQAYLNAVNAADAAAYAGTTDEQVTYTYTETYVDTESVDEAYQNYLNKQAAADAATQQADEALVYETYNEAVAAYEEYLNAAEGQTTTVTEVVTQSGTSQETTVQTSTSGSYSSGSDIASFATQFVGNPYVYGGTSLTNGADCSGFTQSVFANFGISIPRTAAAQSQSGTEVSLDEIQPGDLLFYSDGSGIGHVTMYIGNDQVVHASTSSTGIIISDINYRTPVSARRYW